MLSKNRKVCRMMRHSLLLVFQAAACMLVCAATQATPTLPDYKQAETLVRSGQVDQAITTLNEILQSDPRNLKALNLLGIALTTKGDIAGANRQYKEALRLDPNFVPALKNLSVNEFGEKKLTEAQRHLTTALRLAPADPMIHAYLGRIEYSRHSYRTAAVHLGQADGLLKDPAVAALLIESDLEIDQQQKGLDLLRELDQDHLAPSLKFNLAVALARHELFQQAIPFFKFLTSTFPDSYNAAFNLAICYVQTKQFAPAIEVLKKLVEQGKSAAELENLLAEAYLGNNEIQAAIDALREATRLDPEDESNYVDLATLCTNHDAYEIGLEVIAVGLHYHPQSDRLIFQRGVIEAMMNHFDLADRDFQLASRLAPEKNLSYVGLGVSYLQRGNVQQAIQTLGQRTANKPNDAVLQYLLGEALMRSGAGPGDKSFMEARTALEKSVKLNPKFPAAQVDLGKIYLKENRLDEALQHLEQARALDSKDKGAYSQLAIAYRRKGRPELVRAMLATLNKLNEEERQGSGRQRLQLVEDKSSTNSP
jgi:Flp pilus assembly protein TadD